MTKHLFTAAALAALVAGTALPLDTARASWAETAQTNPVYTGTNQSLRRSERARRHFSYGAGRYYADPGYAAYGAYVGPAPGYYGGPYGGYYGGYWGY
jgi:hypothetical protein